MSLMIAINGLSLIERTLQYYFIKIVASNLKAIQNKTNIITVHFMAGFKMGRQKPNLINVRDWKSFPKKILVVIEIIKSKC